MLLLGMLVCACPFDCRAQLDATLGYTRYHDDSLNNVLEVNLFFDGRTMRPKSQKGGKYSKELEVTIVIKDSISIIAADTFNVEAAWQKDTNAMLNSYDVQRRLAVRTGKYRMFVNAKDLNAHESKLAAEVPVNFNFPKTKPFFSDIQLLSSYKKGAPKGEFVKGGVEMIPYSTAFYPAKLKKVCAYVELYDINKAVKPGEEYLFSWYLVKRLDNTLVPELGSGERLKASAFMGRLKEIDISALPSGDYDLVAEAISREMKLICRTRTTIERLNPSLDDKIDATEALGDDAPSIGTFADSLSTTEVKHCLESALPIASQAEAATIRLFETSHDERKLKDYLVIFWKRRNKADPEIAFRAYDKRVAYAERKYRQGGMKIWQTDRGRVYLQYGKPNQVENEYNDKMRRSMNESSITPYEIWQYYQTEATNQNGSQSNVIFVFVQQNLGNNNYRLIHSNARGEIQNTDWRTAISSKNGSGANLLNTPSYK